jgi:predicted acetyltransferase
MDTTGADLHVRPFAGNWDEFRRIDEIAFGYTWQNDGLAADKATLEMDRSLVASLDGAAAGIASAYSLRLAVPGGAYIPAAGVTWVGVLPTHRRRGVARALMRRQLDDIAAAGREPVAVLWSSEPTIYGRFGYGVAAHRAALELPGDASRLPPVEGEAELRGRITTPAEARAAVEAVDAVTGPRRPGHLATTTDARWAYRIDDPEHRRDGACELRALVLERDGEARAYALYAVKQEWGPGGPNGTVRVRELAAVDPASRAAVWRVLLGHDLTHAVEWRLAPVDDPILTMMTGVRGAVRSVADSLWVRVLDLPAAIAARTYTSPADLVVEVSDGFTGLAAGTWRLTLRPEGGEAVRVETEPDVRCDVADIGAAFLGGASLVQHAEAGRIQGDRAAVARWSAAMSHEPRPWCPWIF